VTTLKMGVAST